MGFARLPQAGSSSSGDNKNKARKNSIVTVDKVSSSPLLLWRHPSAETDNENIPQQQQRQPRSTHHHRNTVYFILNTQQQTTNLLLFLLL